MRILDGYVGIETFPRPDAGSQTIQTRAVQLSHFRNRVQCFYRDTLGLERITTDPMPLEDPESMRLHIELLGLLRRADSVQRAGLQFIGAFELVGYKRVSKGTDALLGLIALQKEVLCTPDTHAPTEIMEWNTFGHNGLGRELLREAAQYIHPADEVTADAVEADRYTIAVLNHYGFGADPDTPPIEHGVFNTHHIRFRTTGAGLRQKLGLAVESA